MSKIVALLAALTLGLAAACGGDDADGGAAASTTASAAAAQEHNDADVAFAQGMIPHHAQAVEMADMALEKSANDQVLDLAERIKGAQQPEIDQMTGWLEAWGEPVEPDAGQDMSDMSDMGGSGDMMSDEEMTGLDGASGAAFDRMWLDMMIRHHEGAIDMAREHQADGQYPEALELGLAIISAQEAEIAEMRTINV